MPVRTFPTFRRRSAAQRSTPGVRNAQPRPARYPGWEVLARPSRRAAMDNRPVTARKFSTAHFALLILLFAASFTAYVGHVRATQQTLAELQAAQRENMRLHLKLNRYKGEIERAASPAVVYRRARTMGLEESPAYGPNITIHRNPEAK